MKRTPTILYCHCAHADVIPAETRRRVLEAIAQSGEACEAVADLCELAARRDPILKQIADRKPVRIIACWPRTVRWLFDYAGATLPKATVIHNMRKEAAEAIMAHIGAGARTTPLRGGSGDPPRDAATLRGGSPDPPRKQRPAARKQAQQRGGYGDPPRDAKGRKPLAGESATPQFPAKKPGEWIPWFPVIDYDRCENCRQCLQFCLFGVYAADEGSKVRVAKPANCKTGCPACARICPHAAIIFPKYAEGSISGDDAPPSAEEGRPEKPIDFSSLAGLDIHEAIRRRSAILRAHQERKSHNE